MTPPPRNHNRPAMALAALAVVLAVGVFAIGWWFYEPPPNPAPDQSAPVEEQPGQSGAFGANGDGPVAAPERADQPLPSGATEPVGTAALDVRLHCQGTPRERRVRFFLGTDHDYELGSASRSGAAVEYATTLRAPVNEWLLVGAYVYEPADAASGVPVAPAWVRLTRGEQRRVDLQCGVQPITIRVLGPSPELLSRLAVLLRPAADPPRLRGQQLVLGLDAKGRAACYLPDGAMRGTLAVKKPTNAGRGVWPRYAATFPLQDEHGAFDLQQTEGELVLSPIESLVGIAVGSPGHEQHAWLSLEAMRRPHEVEPLFLCRRASAESAETLHGSTEQLGPFTMLMANVRTSGDLWFVPPAATNRLGTLVVHVADAPEPGSVVDLLAECIDGARDQARQPTKLDRATGLSSLLPGTYRLLWEVNLGRGPVAAEAVVITAGGITELTLSPPALQRWTLQLRNVDTSRAEALFLKLGTAYSLGAARKGDFLMDRFEPPRVGETGEVFAWVLKCSFPARVVNVDAAALRAEVTSTVTDAVWCHLRAQAMAGGRLGIRLQRTAGLDTTLPAFLDGDIHVPLMPGTTRNGCVLETLEGRTQLVAWFQLSPELPDQVARGSGRWTTLRIERPILRAEVLAAGPPGVDAMSVYTIEKPGEYPLFVADGTRTFHVDLQPGGRQTFDATLPIVVR
ncbi:MAG: hypothetical protein IT456_01160 [Planctomycetes bacterium]|jgi:hypothetical protein|nr:hypothetical protein [Planctomycetota bacterium]